MSGGTNALSTKTPAPYAPRFSLLHGGLSATTDQQRRIEFPKTSKKFSNVTEREFWIYRNAAFSHIVSAIDRVFTCFKVTGRPTVTLSSREKRVASSRPRIGKYKCWRLNYPNTVSSTLELGTSLRVVFVD